MANRLFHQIIRSPPEEKVAPPGDTRAQSIHRLQIGMTGITGMLLLLALANIIQDRAQETEAKGVPEAAATVAVEEPKIQQSDPLVDAGVVPDLPVEPVAPVDPVTPIEPEPPLPEMLGTQTDGSEQE